MDNFYSEFIFNPNQNRIIRKKVKTDKTDKTDKNPTKKFIPKPNIDDTTNDDYISAYKIPQQTNIKDNNFPKSGFLDTNEISQKNANVCEKIGCLKL